MAFLPDLESRPLTLEAPAGMRPGGLYLGGGPCSRARGAEGLDAHVDPSRQHSQIGVASGYTQDET
jgi:hypothetical protein